MMTKPQRTTTFISNKNWIWHSAARPINISTLLVILTFTASLLSACGGQGSLSSTDYFIAPTLSGERQPINLASPTPPKPSPTPYCSNNLEFVADVTIPDGSIFLPDTELEKVWLVKNSGTCNWDNGYLFRLVSGDPMGAETMQGLYPARSGSEVEIKLDFTAPKVAGTYQTMWQAFTPNGEPFGEPIYMLIEIDPDYVTETPDATGTAEAEGTTEPLTTGTAEAEN